MDENKNTRTSMFWDEDLGTWINIHPLKVKKGMYFKMFEGDGTPVETMGKFIWKANKNAFTNDDGVWVIEVREDFETEDNHE